MADARESCATTLYCNLNDSFLPEANTLPTIFSMAIRKKKRAHSMGHRQLCSLKLADYMYGT